MNPLPIAMVAGFLQQNQAKKQAKRQAAANIMAQQAAASGAPTFGIQAQQQMNAINAQPSPFDSVMSQYLQKRAKPAQGAAPAEEDEDFLAGLF